MKKIVFALMILPSWAQSQQVADTLPKIDSVSEINNKHTGKLLLHSALTAGFNPGRT